MPKKFRYHSLLPAFLIGMSVLTGCGGSGGGVDLQSQSFVGNWRLQSVKVDGKTVNCPGTDLVDGQNVACGEGTVRFGLDKSVDLDGVFNGNLHTRERGSWTLSDNVLTLTFTEAGVDTDHDGTIEDGELRPLSSPLTVRVGLSGDKLTLLGTGDNGSDLGFDKG